ncbi:LAQU0S43e00100g1_1 [Lachancea quebecensis]|uniref:LAQU0S43e00100g1_1 n=1 Tax=Lachancea quebecensis TaxID=1654605 RepID=A0A0P1KY94_9SACH|nr:LAQU0S43e00100g1_1 [Lachancea quebecensis]
MGKSSEDIKTNIVENKDSSIAKPDHFGYGEVEYLGDTSDILSTQQVKKLRWKIDMRIMPLCMMIYFLQYLDKTLLNYAAVMGIKKNLHGDQFSDLGTIFYVGYLAAEPLSGVLIQKLPVGKFLGLNVTLWGAVVCFHAATTTFPGLMAVRVLLGVFEASVAGCLIVITGMWWTKPEQSRRTGLWYMQIGTGQIIGALLSFGFQHVSNTKLESWQILFIFMGCLTVVVGIITTIFMPDNNLTCKFLTEAERAEAVEHVKINQTGIENKTIKWPQIRELLLQDKQTWILFFITVLTMITNGTVSNFTGVIISSFDFSDKKATIFQIPSGVVSIIATITCSYLAGYIGQRCYLMGAVCIPSIVGAILLLVLDKEHRVGKLFGVYLLNSAPAILPMIYNWNSVNTSGHTKRVARNALTLMAFCVGNLIGPQMFKVKDAPNYSQAKIALIAQLAAAVILCLILRAVVVAENKARDHICIELDPEMLNRDNTFLDLTDIENVNFRYEY